jgi:hypothetical protein
MHALTKALRLRASQEPDVSRASRALIVGARSLDTRAPPCATMPLDAMHHGPSERCDCTVSRVIAARPRTRPNVFVLGWCSAVSAVAAVSAWCGLEKSDPGDFGRAPMLLHVLQGPMQARSRIAARDSGPRPGVKDAC